MAFPSRVLHQASVDTSPCAASDARADDIEASTSFEEDLEFIRTTRANLLVIGPDCLVMPVVRQVVADVNRHVVIPCRAGGISTSRLSSQPTIVLRDVDALDAEGQQLLFDWLDNAPGDRQVVSTASAPLLPRVNAGAFDRGLYYRLNTVYVRLCD